MLLRTKKEKQKSRMSSCPVRRWLNTQLATCIRWWLARREGAPPHRTFAARLLQGSSGKPPTVWISQQRIRDSSRSITYPCDRLRRWRSFRSESSQKNKDTKTKRDRTRTLHS